LALAALALSGCYSYVPLGSAVVPEPGDRIQVELNDAGRVGMEGELGPEAGKVEGTLVSASDTAVVMKVAQVWGEYGGLSRWEGEQVTFRTSYIRTMGRRRFSSTRTAILAATVGAGMVAFVAARDLLGYASPPGSKSGSGSGGIQ
jgi:hypothetical protein